MGEIGPLVIGCLSIQVRKIAPENKEQDTPPF